MEGVQCTRASLRPVHWKKGEDGDDDEDDDEDEEEYEEETVGRSRPAGVTLLNALPSLLTVV